MGELRADLSKVKKSYFNLLSAYKSAGKMDGRYLPCIVKWGIQLGVNADDLRDQEKSEPSLPSEKTARIEALYHLVYMIYLDRVVEDLELEVAADYAIKLGFQKELVGDLFKSIATIPYDATSPQDIQKEVEDFIKIQNG
ncbi:MAG TPA: hypothetical protein VL728_10375 [Cyclobacteriaceae bacterium]|jgi:hypothetical protein|nr:hypothetical protein [Cyclobacteriaceae bacterium]